MNRLLISVAALSAVIILPVHAAEVDVQGTVDSTVSGAADTTAGSAGANAETSASGGANVDTSGNASANATTQTYVAGTVTADTIDVNNPFGTLTIDETVTPEQLDATLTADTRAEFEERCGVILQDPARFQTAIPAFCTTYMDWKKQNPTVQ
jgi:hypothetical protein